MGSGNFGELGVKHVKAFVNWITACWACDICTWFQLVVSVVSCTIRTVITIAILYAAVHYGGKELIREMGNTIQFSK